MREQNKTVKKLTASVAAVIVLAVCLCVTTFALAYSVVAADEIKEVLTRVRAADQHAFINCLKTDSLTGRFYRRPND